MRKPRDYDAELKALDARAKKLKNRKVSQLGELVIATGADTLRRERQMTRKGGVHATPCVAIHQASANTFQLILGRLRPLNFR